MPARWIVRLSNKEEEQCGHQRAMGGEHKNCLNNGVDNGVALVGEQGPAVGVLLPALSLAMSLSIVQNLFF